MVPHRTPQRQTEAIKEKGSMWNFQFFQGINCQKQTWQEPCDYLLSSHTEKSNKESQLLWWKCNLAVTLYSKMAKSCPCHETLLMEGTSSLRKKLLKWIKNDSTGWCFGLSNAGKHGKYVPAPQWFLVWDVLTPGCCNQEHVGFMQLLGARVINTPCSSLNQTCQTRPII